MNGEHLSFETLVGLVDGDPAGAEAEAHLNVCDACRSDLLLLRRMEEAWSDEAPAPSGSTDTRQAIANFAQRVAAEDAAARELVGPLVDAGTGTFALGIARRGARYRTGGVVRALCAAAREALAENALKALTLADEAIEIASALPDDAYPSGHVFLLRGNAWKERANALRFLGESYAAALDAVEHAARAYRVLPVADFHLAACDYVRATIFFRMDRFDDALAHARRAAETFLAFRDVIRYMHARSIEGNVLYDSARYDEARPIFAELLAGAETMGETATAVGFAINLAATEIELGALDRASMRLGKVLETCNRNALETDAAHARWILATIPLHAGRPIEAAELLERALDDCRKRGLFGNATRVALDLAEAYAAIPRPADVVRVATAIVGEFVARGQLTSAMTAFAFLRDAAAKGTLTIEQVRHVKAFMSTLERRPASLFVPPR